MHYTSGVYTTLLQNYSNVILVINYQFNLSIDIPAAELLAKTAGATADKQLIKLHAEEAGDFAIKYCVLPLALEEWHL